MNQNKNRVILWSYLLLLMLLFSACTAKENNKEENNSETEISGIYYQIQETALPNPNEELLKECSAEAFVRELDMMLADDTVYRVAQLWDEVNGMDMTLGYYLQILKPPYTSWDTQLVPSSVWDPTLEYEGFQYNLWGLLGVYEDKILCKVHEFGETVNERLGYYSLNGEGELLGALPLEEEFRMFEAGNGNLYAYLEVPGNQLTVLDAELNVLSDKRPGGKIYGMYEDPVTKEIFWYGEKEDGYGCWNLENGEALCQGGRELSFLGGAMNPNKELFLGDTQSIWRFSAEEKEGIEICDFVSRGYLLEDIIAMTAPAEEEMNLLVQMDGENYLLQLTEKEQLPPPKQQIYLAMPFEVPVLRDFIARFNRQSELWEVIPVLPEVEGDGLAYGEQIQLELAAGRGPDLVMGGLIDPRALARNGYLQSMDGILPEEEYWEPALECGKINGVLYGIPYEANLLVASYSSELTQGKMQWTVEEMIKAVRASEAEILEQGYGGVEIVLYYGLSDNENKQFIDWERKESHLSEQPFIELLQFSYDYRDDGTVGMDEVGEALQEGKIAAISGPADMGKLEFLKECFAGKDSNIGYPRSEGNGIYVSSNMLYLNSNSAVREGAIEFLKFISSKETQMRYAENDTKAWKPNSITYGCSFAIRKDALERQIELKRQEKPTESLSLMYGVYYQHKGLSEEREEILQFLLSHAEPDTWNINAVMDILSEELDPFFAGQCSAEEAARKLDNRVQLYLDEQY